METSDLGWLTLQERLVALYRAAQNSSTRRTSQQKTAAPSAHMPSASRVVVNPYQEKKDPRWWWLLSLHTTSIDVGSLQSQEGLPPEAGSDVGSDGATHTPRVQDQVCFSITEPSVEGRAGLSSRCEMTSESQERRPVQRLFVVME